MSKVTTMYARVKALIGKRVRVRRGTMKHLGRPAQGYEEAGALWCAGAVPVGSTGTVIDLPSSKCLVQVKWDHDQHQQPGYEFGISRIDHELEEIDPPDEVVTEDGYAFKRQNDGSYTNGDMTFDTLGHLATEVDFTIPGEETPDETE